MSFQKLFRTYGCWGLFRLLLDYLHTKLLFPNARMVRRPTYLRGKFNIRWGKRLTTGVGVRLDVFCNDNEQRLVFGDDVQLNDYVHIGVVERIEIGNDVLIASKVFITDHNHGSYSDLVAGSEPYVSPVHRPLVSKPVYIGDRVWIGEQVCILPGVNIGEGAIVGAGSIVTRDVPANSIVAGNPARILRVFNAESGVWQRV
ncbi:DapH/DapD/GlmU-related protein [Methylomonas methanica]|uniref:Putative lipopolysaccharide biosynthesis O-acetyl transferase WbbJ n=1 Tax=Methylomonas methanica (strain DSM 25384 / MC09) TaxID=857087 RepID=F9ZWF0_METMM|nr:DapH/DapD/GlmU-related protein [Methylomonas methanica]AEF99619.1 putative lipopolysaccharide biosynthesis O-acetyl transferase WbbJ [Methylomonas methanica MC09]